MALDEGQIEDYLNARGQASQQEGFDSVAFTKEYSRGLDKGFSRDAGRRDEGDDGGFVKQTATALAGGAVDAGELWMRAIRAVDPEGGNDVIRDFATFGLDSIKNFVAKHPSLSPDAQVEKGVKSWWTQGVRSLIPSLAPSLVGATAGLIGGPAGAAVGGGVLSSAVFGLAEFDKFHEEVEERITELGLTGEEAEAMRQEARNPAIFSAITEGGLEGAANALQIRTLGKFLPGMKGAKGVAKKSIKQLFTKNKKQALKDAGKTLVLTTPVEVGTEFAQSAIETKFRRDIGLTDMSSMSAGIQALGPALVTNLLFFGMGRGANAWQRYNIRNSLEKAVTNPRQRVKAIKNIGNTVRGIGGEIDIGGGEKISADEYATRLEKSAKGFVRAELNMDLSTEVGVTNTLGQYVEALRLGHLKLSMSRKMEKQLAKSLDKEDMSTGERVSATQLHQGLKGINDQFAKKQRTLEVVDQKQIDEARAIPEEQRKAKLAGRRAKGKEIVEANRLETLANQARGEDVLTETPASLAAKEISKERPEEEEFVTAGASEALSNLFVTNVDDVKAKLKKERDIVRAETDLTKVGELAEREQQEDIEKQARKKQLEDIRAEKERPLEVPEEEVGIPEEAVEEAPQVVTEEEVIEAKPEEEPTTEELEAEEVRPTAITPEQEKAIRKELRSDDITPEEKADLEGALKSAGLPLVVKPTERQRKNIRKAIEKTLSKEVGVPATGKKRKISIDTDKAELAKNRGKLLQQLTVLRTKKDSIANEKQIEEVREQIREIQEVQNAHIIEDTVIEISTAGVQEQSIEQLAKEAEAFVQANQLEQADLSVVDKEGVKTVFLGITPELARTGQAELKGRKISGGRELATMAQVFSNPQFETLRIIYLKGRTIVHHEGLTSRLPNQVKAFKADAEKVEKTRQEHDADGVYMIHNHPSGDASPSNADLESTQAWAGTVKELQGHIVINSENFTFINTSGKAQRHELKTERPDLEVSIPNKIVTKRIKTGNDVAELTKTMQNPKGFVNAVYLSTRNDVRLLQEIPISHISNPREMARLLRERAKHSGSSKTFITFDKKNHPELAENIEPLRMLISTGVVEDIIINDGASITSVKEQFGLATIKDSKFFLGEKVETFAVQEEKKDIKFQKEGAEERTLKKDRVKNDVDDKTPKAKEIRESKLGPGYEARTVKQIYKKWTTNLMTRFRQGVIDQYVSIKVLDEKIWKLVQQTQSVNGAIETLFNWGPVHLTEGVPDTSGAGKQGLADVLKPLGNEVEPFLAWVAANRANELIQPTKEHPKGRETNLTQDEIDILLKTNEGTMKDGKSRKSVWRKANKDMMKLHKSVVNIGIETGTINKQEAESWNQDFYIPFFRHIAENDKQTEGPKTLSGLTNQTAIRQLKGKPVPVADMLSNIMLNWNHILSASMKNQSARAVLAKAEKSFIEGGAPVAQRLADDMEVKENDSGKFEVVDKRADTEKGTVIGTFDTFGEAEQHLNFRTEKRAKALAKSGDRVVFVRENGKKVWYEVNEPNVYGAIANLQWEGFNNTAMKAMRQFKRFLTFGVTFSPEFKIRNLIRDTITSVGVSKISPNIIDNGIIGSKTTFKDNLANARIRAGGGFIEFGHQYGTDPEKEAIRIRKGLKNEFILDNPNALKKFNSKVGGVFRWWNEFGSKLENVNRGALAAQELGKGKSFLEANFQARDLLDFNRQGAFPAVRFLIDTIPFLNARIQGLDKLGRALGKDSGQRARALATIGAVSMASMALYLTFRDDDDFQSREEWDRDTYWWFKLPGSEQAYRIPKPFEIGAIGTMAERILEQWSDDKVHGELFFERLKFAITQTFSFDAVPQIAKPIIELAANKNFFTDRPIETLAMQNLSPTERRKAWTSETAIVLSRGLNKIPWDKVKLSPVQVEHLVQGYLGWVGASGIGFVDQVLTQPLGDFPGRPSRRIEEFPIIGPFVRTQPARATKYSTMFYEQLKEMNQTYADIRNFRTIGESDKAIELARKEKDNLKFRRFANRRQKQIANYTKRIRLTRLSKTMSPREKRMMIDRLTEIKNRLLKVSVERLQS